VKGVRQEAGGEMKRRGRAQALYPACGAIWFISESFLRSLFAISHFVLYFSHARLTLTRCILRISWVAVYQKLLRMELAVMLHAVPF
jgi:hypothetical protein